MKERDGDARTHPLGQRLRARAVRSIADRTLVRYLAGVLLLLSLASAVLVWILDREDFPTLGDAFWWAIVTLSTVGYGDIVPHSGWGRALGSIVIVCGVTLFSLLTAVVTSVFVAAQQDERAAEIEAIRGDETKGTHAALAEILERLEAIERRLEAAEGDDPTG